MVKQLQLNGKIMRDAEPVAGNSYQIFDTENATNPRETAKDADVDFGGLAVGGESYRSVAIVAPPHGAIDGNSERQRRTATMRSPTAFGHRIFASIRLRAWYPVYRFRNARP